MDEVAAREVSLLRAMEAAEPALPAWSAADRAWAARVAAETVGASAAPDAYIAARAHAGLQRMLPRDKPAARELWRALRRPLWRGGWIAAGVVVGLLLGLGLDVLTSSNYINLLSLLVFGVLGWNAIAYGLLLVRGLVRITGRPMVQGPIVSALRGLGRFTADPVRPKPLRELGIAAVWPDFLAQWGRASAPLLMAGLAAVLHAAAAAVAVGGLAALYLRGLVFDYRAGWQSTFLDPEFVHGLLTRLLGPAAALTGIPLPEVAGIAALQLGPGAVGAPAAPWIHLYAVTVGLFVIGPRSVLALAGGVRARRLARRFPLRLDEPYYQHLLRQYRQSPARVRIWPHALPPSAQATLGLRAACARVWGEGLTLAIQPVVAYGDEEAAVSGAATDVDVALALFDLGATPEAEQQGRLVESLGAALPAGTPVLLVVDEAGFRTRFATMPERLAQRQAAWTAFADGLAVPVVFIDLGDPDLAAAEAGLQAALDQPATRVAA